MPWFTWTGCTRGLLLPVSNVPYDYDEDIKLSFRVFRIYMVQYEENYQIKLGGITLKVL